jgi:hypothetical protein
MTNKVKDIIFILGYILIGILTRTVWHIAPNVEFITALTLGGAYFIRRNYSLVIPFGIMFISDMIIGNQAIYIFTWSAFGIAWLMGKLMNMGQIQKFGEKLPRLFKLALVSETSGILFTLLFFLWTNFGVVVTTTMYPKTLEGVILSYTMGLPFLVPQLVGNIIIVPAVFVVTEIAYHAKTNFINKLFIK